MCAVMKRVGEGYRKVRNTFRFFLGNLDGFDPNTDAVPVDELLELDRWILQRTGDVVRRIEQAYEEFQFHLIYHTLTQFAAVELSNVYLDVTKDRMYCSAPGSFERRSGQTAYWMVLHALLRAVAPVLTFTAQEAWALMPHLADTPEHVFLADFPAEARAWTDLLDPQPWDALLEVRAEVQKALEAKRGPKKDKRPDQIGSSQEADVTVTADGDTFDLLTRFDALDDRTSGGLAELFIVSNVTLTRGTPADPEALVTATVTPSTKARCARCWNHWGLHAESEDLCVRCFEVV